MMNQIRKIIKDLDRGIAPRKNLPIYATYLADTYLNYASIILSHFANVNNFSSTHFDICAYLKTGTKFPYLSLIFLH